MDTPRRIEGRYQGFEPFNLLSGLTAVVVVILDALQWLQVGLVILRELPMELLAARQVDAQHFIPRAWIVHPADVRYTA